MPVTDWVRPLKLESPSGGGTQLDLFPKETDPSEDGVIVAGVGIETSNTRITRDSGANMVFTDPIAGSKTLSELAQSGAGLTSEIEAFAMIQGVL